VSDNKAQLVIETDNFAKIGELTSKYMPQSNILFQIWQT
jgi:hypothetical protein